MPKDRRVKLLSSDQSRSSPYHCSSNNTEQCKPQSSLGSDESVKKWKNVRCPISVDHPRDKAEDPRSSLRSTEDAKEWEEIRCPICMEHPHNAVLLQCSSFGKGCQPYMCNTSYRHSNCLDQFRKSSVPSPSTELLQETPSVSNNRTREELELLGQTRHYESGLQPKLCCPLCRGEIYGWTVVKPAREFMNSRLRSCSLETCDFSGNYSELRKHSRSEHPFIQPSKVDPQRQLDWTNFEYERYVEDMYALTREEQEEPDWTNFEYERYVEDMAAMFALTMEEQEEPDWTNFEHERDVVNSSNPYDYPAVIMDIQFTNLLSRSILPLDHDMEASNTSRQTNNFRRISRNMLPAGYEMGSRHDNRRTTNFRRNNSSRSNIPERMWPDRNSYRQNDSFRRNRNVSGNSNLRNNRMGGVWLRRRPSERMP
ncbi:Zinc finger, RING/FYVE/PHD-type [Salix suchowensis]|nr:Zinc finger, RING/FYVE/PHD-type [Salix suchowensis]